MLSEQSDAARVVAQADSEGSCQGLHITSHMALAHMCRTLYPCHVGVWSLATNIMAHASNADTDRIDFQPMRPVPPRFLRFDALPVLSVYSHGGCTGIAFA